MPTYEYRCRKCGHTFEKFQSITAEPVRRCPACGKNSAERLISAGAGVIFKGSGFYETDYKRSGEKPDARADDSGSESKSESKSKAEGSGGESKSPKDAGKTGSGPSSGAASE
jgi:putative FmdB family regulatory protein